MTTSLNEAASALELSCKKFKGLKDDKYAGRWMSYPP
jgi:hypothetical protein